MVNRLHWMWETYPYLDGERACQKTALSFVDSVAEIFGPLLKGVPTSIIDDDSARDPRTLVESLSRSATTRIVLVPSVLEAILELPMDLAGPLDRLRTWTSSGEFCARTLRNDFSNGFRTPGCSTSTAPPRWRQTLRHTKFVVTIRPGILQSESLSQIHEPMFLDLRSNRCLLEWSERFISAVQE